MIDKKRILVLTDWFLPGYKAGGPVRSCANLIAHLKDSFSFSVLTRNTDYCETNPYENVQSDAWNKIHGAKVYYLSHKRTNWKNLKRLISNTPSDVIYINGVYSWYFSILPLIIAKWFNHPRKKIIVAPRGMFAKSAIGIKSGKKRIFISLAKLLGLYKNITFQATSKGEIEDIVAVAHATSKIVFAPNLSAPFTGSEPKARQKKQGELKLCCLARISKEKNQSFILEVLKQCPHLKISVDFIGPVYDPSYWQVCLQQIDQLPASIHVQHLGPLAPETIANQLQNYHLLFFPSLGENHAHAIVESLLAGCLVLTSDQTPWRNMKENAMGWDLPLSAQHLFVEALEYACGLDQEKFNEHKKNAFEFVKNKLTAKEPLEQNKKLFLA